MNKIVILFITLLICFCGVWVAKSKAPINKQYNEAEEDAGWWNDGKEIRGLSNVVDKDWVIDERIPADYVPVMGQDNLYMQVDTKGKIVAYWKAHDNGISIEWEKVNPDIPDYFTPVDGLDDVYMVKDDKSGIVKYIKYVRNDDNTYSFVEVNENGQIIDKYITDCEKEAAQKNEIPVCYSQYDGNVYEVKDQHGVVVGYKEKSEDNSGKIIWTLTAKPKNSGDKQIIVTNPQVTQPNQKEPKQTTTKKSEIQPPVTSQKDTHIQQETHTEEKIEGQYKYTYQYVFTKVLDKNGKILETKTEGPTLINKEYIGPVNIPQPNKSLIENNIDRELARVVNNAEYKSDMSQKLLNTLNAERASSKLSNLSNSKTAQTLAVIYAADMATYDNYTDTSPMYGKLEDLMKRYSITNKGCAINVWRLNSDDTANEIHKRFQATDSTRKIRMNTKFTQVGEAIFFKNGHYYVAEVLLV